MIVFAFFFTGITKISAQNPVAAFTANVTSGCAPLTVSFTDQSTGSPTSWNWEFSNGTLSSVQNPVVSFSLPGTYSVKLVVQNANGIGQVEKINYITVFQSPVVNFTANFTLGCLPSTIQFTDVSTSPGGTITAWEWDFGDGGTSTQQNPSHTYTTTGFYSVTLSVTNSNGCKVTSTRSSYIRIVGGVDTDFSFSLPNTCQGPFSVNFQNQSGGPGNITYNWDFGNGQTSTVPNPVATYANAGTYTVQLNAISDLGCSGSKTKTITITSTTTDFNSPTNICLNQPATFQNNSSAPPVSSFWNFGDGTFSAQVNPVKTYLSPGTYDVTLVNTYANCVDSITHTVVVNDKPVIAFTADDTASCTAPLTVQFTDQTPGATNWQWDFGDGNTSSLQNPSHQYNNFGVYSVTLTATTSAGCTNTLTKTNYIIVRPVTININVPQGGCIPFTYTPRATIQSVEPIASYAWDLGAPGATFNVANPPPYTYTAAGNYTISLTVTTVNGCTQTATIPGGVLTGVPPVVNFSASPLNACASDTINFTDASVTTPGAQVSWQWNFGDGNSSSLQNPQHVFTDTGAITVTLIVSNNRCTDSVKQVLQVRPPVALFNYTVDCITSRITFRDSSLVDAGLSPLTYLWEMGDPANTQFNVPNPPPFLYPAPGTYIVRLTVTNGPCSYTTTKSVTISQEPADFSISKNPVCKNESFTLTAINSNPASIASYQWTVGGTVLPGTGRSVSHTLTTNGNYDVTLTITDNNGCITTKTITGYITVDGPIANFTPATPGACLGKTVTFTDLSTSNAAITNWEFLFGDGTQQAYTTGPFTHTYATLGGFNVSMTVTDVNGCSSSYTLPTDLLVTQPKAGFRADTIYCPGVALPFVDSSSGAGLTYLWDFGDGGSSTLANPGHIYPLGDAQYTVKLKIRDISGCEDSVTRLNYIKIRSPKAAFDIRDTTTICPPLRTSFTFMGSDYSSFYWDFGDGGQSTAPNPSYYYGNFGTFTPTLYLTGPGGCMDSAKSSVTVHNPATFSVAYGPVTTACNSLTLDFNLGVPPGYKFYFYFGDGVIDSSGATSLTHFFPRPSINRPVLVVFDTLSGCQAYTYGNAVINVLGAIPLFGMDRDEFCDNGRVVFTDFTTKNEPIISTQWDFGDGTTSTATSPTHDYTQPGTYIVRLNITTQSNCSSSFEDTVFVHRTPVPLIDGRDTICVGVNEAYAGSTLVADTLTSWQWSFGNGQSSTNPSTNVTYNTTGNFTIQLITGNKIGCKDTATKNIYVSPPPTATPVQDPITIISGSGTDLAMTYTGNITSYTWTPNYRLSCADCPQPFATPQFTSTYSVALVDAYGCKNSQDITVAVVCNDLNFFIPNTFSPNGDGQNEVFYPRGTGLFRIKSMTVFNRWGQAVFEKKDFLPNDQAGGWKGDFKGQKASADVYVYIIEILCSNNTLIPVKGNVTLLR